MTSNKDIINEQHPDLVKNWNESAGLLSFIQVIQLMTLARKDELKSQLKPQGEKVIKIRVKGIEEEGIIQANLGSGKYDIKLHNGRTLPLYRNEFSLI